ncbi:hypothetical protein Gasu2_47680 [Galdieria sulphuraria]|nr:hypothetical protein Gasu2_47680 [Galdieria sulphuraria]
MRSVGCWTRLQKLWSRKVLDNLCLWKPCLSFHYTFTKSNDMGIQWCGERLFTTEIWTRHYSQSTSWRKLLKSGFLILAPCIYFAVSNPISNDSNSSSSLRTLTSKDLLEAAKEAARAIELKSSRILNLYSVASRSPSFIDMKQREQSALEALSLADRWVQKLQSLLFTETQSPFPTVDWRKWLMDIGSVFMGMMLITCIRFVSRGCSVSVLGKNFIWKPSLWSIRLPMLLFTALVSLMSSFIHPWNGINNILYLFHKQRATWNTNIQSSTDWDLSNWEAIEDENVRHALLELEKASVEEQNAMEKYNVLQNIISTSLLQREEQHLLEEYQYRISQAQEEIANSEARWNRWMLGIRRLDILEAIGLSTATRMAQLCDEYQQYFQSHQNVGTFTRCWVNLWSLSLALALGKYTETIFQRYFSEKQETSSLWNSIFIGWITNLVKKFLFGKKELKKEWKTGWNFEKIRNQNCISSCSNK